MTHDGRLVAGELMSNHIAHRPNTVLCLALVALVGVAARVSYADPAACAPHLAEFALSPDGGKLAELLDAEPEGCDGSRLIVEYAPFGRGIVKTIPHGAGVSQIAWVTNSSIGFVTGQADKELAIVNVDTDRAVTRIRSGRPILQYAASPAGDRVLYVFSRWERSKDYVSVRVPASAGLEDFARADWAEEHKSFGTSSTVPWGVEQVARVVSLSGDHRPPAEYVSEPHLIAPVWLADTQPAVLRSETDTSVWGRALVSVPTGRTVLDGSQLLFINAVAANSAGQIAVASMGPPDGRFPSARWSHLYVVSGKKIQEIPAVPSVRIGKIWWQGVRDVWVSVEATEPPGGALSQSLVEVDWRNNRIVRRVGWPGGSLENCQLSGDRTVAVCQAESLNVAARLVAVDLRTGKVAAIDDSVPPPRQLNLQFQDVPIRNRFGEVSTSFLAAPAVMGAQDDHGTRGVPLAVLLYDFHRKFAGEGQWTHAYPIERMVHAGIAVLMLNFPYDTPWRWGDVGAARKEELESPLSTVLNAPEAVEKATGRKVGKAMVMGWSWGSLIAAHAIEDSCRYVAAEAGDPATWNITAYAIGDKFVRTYLEFLFGGPPDRRYIDNYLAFDPSESGLPPKGPIMFEFVSRDIGAGQYLQEWRGEGAYVEAFVYHYSPHALTVPSEARLSQERNLAWAKFNLLGAQSESPQALQRLGLSAPPASSYRCGSGRGG